MAGSAIQKGPCVCGIIGAVLLVLAGISVPVVQHFIDLEVIKVLKNISTILQTEFVHIFILKNIHRAKCKIYDHVLCTASCSTHLFGSYICMFASNVFQQVTLTPGTELYGMWKEPNVPIYMQFYVFDLSNPSEVLKGEKPFVVQKGPYSYRYVVS